MTGLGENCASCSAAPLLYAGGRGPRAPLAHSGPGVLEATPPTRPRGRGKPAPLPAAGPGALARWVWVRNSDLGFNPSFRAWSRHPRLQRSAAGTEGAVTGLVSPALASRGAGLSRCSDLRRAPLQPSFPGGCGRPSPAPSLRRLPGGSGGPCDSGRSPGTPSRRRATYWPAAGTAGLRKPRELQSELQGAHPRLSPARPSRAPAGLAGRPRVCGPVGGAVTISEPWPGHLAAFLRSESRGAGPGALGT